MHYLNKETEEEEEALEVTKVIGNEIFYYGDITPENILEFTEKFRKLGKIENLKNRSLRVPVDPPMSAPAGTA